MNRKRTGKSKNRNQCCRDFREKGKTETIKDRNREGQKGK